MFLNAASPDILRLLLCEQVLVQYGANPMSETKGLSTPLHHACRSGHEQMAEV